MLNEEFRRLVGFVESGEESLRRLLCRRNASSQNGTFGSSRAWGEQPKPRTAGASQCQPTADFVPPFAPGGAAAAGGIEAERAAARKALQQLGLSHSAAERLLNECHSLTAAELISEALRRYRT